MYDIFPKSLKEFIEDSTIRLPRFQRKASWDYKKRFELALSIFKNYPLGASILSKEIVDGNLTEWLLDGRQRRDSLKIIYWNPEELYTWAKKYLPIKKGQNIDDIATTFRDKVADFIEEPEKDVYSEIEKENGFVPETKVEDENDNDDSSIDVTDLENDSETDAKVVDQQELDSLLSLIKIAYIYKKNDSYSGLTYSFDFSDYLTGKAFVSNFYSEDKAHVDCIKLRKFIQDYVLSVPKHNQVDEFIKYLDSRFDWKKPDSKDKLETKLNNEWSERQLKIIECFKKIDVIFLNRKIAIIETHTITPTDSQKIFNLINTGGTKLTASEILSAKPKWNVSIANPSQKMQKAIQKLYKGLEHGEGEYTKFVRWDIPASITYFFDDSDSSSGFSLFFKINDDDVANRITNGFKILSGLLTKGVKKEEINELYKVINWEDYEDKINEIKEFFDLFKQNKYLNTIQSWGKCLSDVLSDGPTMNMLFILYRNWVDLGKPKGFSSEAMKIYNKNIFIILDRCVYEYLSNQWKGSSDSTIARNIDSYMKGNETDSKHLLEPIPDNYWKTLIETLSSKNMINGKLITKGILAPLVFYYNCLKGINGDGYDNPGEIDHIMPQSLWNSSAATDKDAVQNNVFNLALLPKNINSPKKDQVLSSITDENMIALISKYEEIEAQDFVNYSNISKYPELKQKREKLYSDVFEKKRKEILNNA